MIELFILHELTCIGLTFLKFTHITCPHIFKEGPNFHSNWTDILVDLFTWLSGSIPVINGTFITIQVFFMVIQFQSWRSARIFNCRGMSHPAGPEKERNALDSASLLKRSPYNYKSHQDLALKDHGAKAPYRQSHTIFIHHIIIASSSYHHITTVVIIILSSPSSSSSL